jgi:hypothetical protein
MSVQGEIMYAIKDACSPLLSWCIHTDVMRPVVVKVLAVLDCLNTADALTGCHGADALMPNPLSASTAVFAATLTPHGH